MAGEFEGKCALVTGGGIGIGRSIALALADAGARVAITYRSHEPDAELTRGLGDAGLAVPLDATSDQAVREALQVVDAMLGGLDILINNAGGLVKRQSIADMDLDLWHTVLAVNLDTMFLVTHHALPYLRDGGRIVNIASLAGHNGGAPGSVAYGTSKAAVFGFTRGLSKELAPRRITVNAVAPGLILDTPFHATFTAPEAQAASIEAIALKRPGWPADVAGPVLALCSSAFSFVTGSIVDINGGQYFA